GGGDAAPGEAHGPGARHEFGEVTGPVPEVVVRCGALGRGPGGLPDPHHGQLRRPPGPDASCAHTTSRSPRRRSARAASRAWVRGMAGDSRAMIVSIGGTHRGRRTA